MTMEEQWLLKEKYRGEKTEGFFADCARLASGEPLAYVIGHIPFLNTNIYLDSRPLIPRVETEFWVERAIEEIRARSQDKTESMRVLDLCAGSGCIGVAVLASVETAIVDFGEIDVSHYGTIQKNIEANAIDTSRTRIFSGDLFTKADGLYDFILTNPPYIPNAAPETDVSVLAYEPHRALFGGESGLECITHLLSSVVAFMTSRGVMYLEHDPQQAEDVVALGSENGLAGVSYPDQYNRLRYTRLTRTEHKNV